LHRGSYLSEFKPEARAPRHPKASEDLRNEDISATLVWLNEFACWLTRKAQSFQARIAASQH